jgi:HK97 family phage major capsid protein
LSALDEVIEKAIGDNVSGVITEEDFTKKFNEELAKVKGDLQAETKITVLEEALRKQGIAITGLKEMARTKSGDSRQLSIKEQMVEQLKDPKVKAAFDNWREKGEGWFKLELKAAATMTIAQTNTDYSVNTTYVPNPQFVPGLLNLVRNRPFIKQFANYGATSSPVIVWVEKINPQGTAQFIGEGAAKPLGSFEYQAHRSDAKKVAEKMKVSTEMITDVDFMSAEIQNELLYQVAIAVDNALLSGNGSGANLAGITSFVGGYTNTSIKTTAPNDMDAIRAAIGQIASFNFYPNYAFVNPIDAANMDLVKTTQNAYVIPPFMSSTGMMIKGVQVIETNQIPQGSFLCGDMTRFIIRDYIAFFVQYGWENDDFTKNLVTVIGEERLHSYLATNHIHAFVYDTFANVIAAITAP